jgi:4-amino-4-deoxy-L-arabinose transferase-like glycosyltransferase
MPRSLLLIAILYLAMTLTYLIAVPVGEAPDEPAHFLYAQHLADTGTPPAQPPPQRDSFWKNDFVTSNYEWHHPPFYYTLGALVLRTGRFLSLVDPYRAFPAINPDFPGTMRPLFVPAPLRFTEVHLLRLLSALLGLGTVCVSFFLARRLFPNEPWLPEMSAGFVATIPQFNFLHAYVTNDALAIFGSSLGLLGLVSVALSSTTDLRRNWLLAGCGVAIAVAAKMTTWYLLPLAFFLAIAQWKIKPRAPLKSVTDFLLFIAIAATGLLLSRLLWPDLFQRLFNSPQSGGINPDFLTIAHLRTIIPMAHTSFWGMFGWVNMPLPSSLLWVLDAILLTGLAGAFLSLLRCRRKLSKSQWIGVLLLWGSIGSALAAFWYFNLTAFQPQGRFLFTALPAIGLLVGLGWLHWAGRFRGWVTLGVVLVMASVNLTGLATVIFPNFNFLAG